MNNELPLISVIIPVYKVESRIEKCLDCVLCQTYNNWECLLIDDGSPDQSGTICDKYAEKDKRFKVFHKKNGGASSARNYGLERAKGDWVAFIDSDDAVLPDYLLHLQSGIAGDDSIVISNYNPKYPTGKSRTLEGGNFVKDYIESHISALSGPYGKLYNLTLIKNEKLLFPPNINMGEDAIFVLRYLNKISRISIVDEMDYVMQSSERSLSKRYYSFDSEYDCFLQWRELLVTLFKKWGVYEGREIEMAWRDRVEEQFVRVIQCVYRCKIYSSIRIQLQYLRTIEKQFYKEYRKYGCPDNWRRWINWWLVCNDYLLLFCLLGKFDPWKEK